MRSIDYKAKLCGNTVYTYSYYANPPKKNDEDDDDWFSSLPKSRSNEYLEKIKKYKEYVKECDDKQKQSFDEYKLMGLDDEIALALSNCFFRFTAEHFKLYKKI